MATKFVVLAAVLAALIAVASASTYTTVVTTRVDEEGNPQQSCQQEIQRFETQRCRQYFQSGRGSPYLRSAVEFPQYEEQYLNECCNELKSVSSPCRCEAIRHAMRQVQQQQPGMQEQEWQLKEKAQSLPSQCRFTSPRQCQITTLFV